MLAACAAARCPVRWPRSRERIEELEVDELDAHVRDGRDQKVTADEDIEGLDKLAEDVRGLADGQ